MFWFLGEKINGLLNEYGLDDIYEIRVRANAPLIILTKSGQVEFNRVDLILTQNQLNKCLLMLTEHSLYAHIQTISQGYVTMKNGIRVGVCGTCVIENNEVKIIKDITSFSIRLPHEIMGVANEICKNVFNNGPKSLLIISPPNCGKTTYLRDIIHYLSHNYKFNILVLDQRNEISGFNRFNLGKTCDVLQNTTKNFGFYYGIKSMNPDLIACDELISPDDINGVIFASLSGVKVVATAHADSLINLKKKSLFKGVFENNVFDYAIILGKNKRIKLVEKINDS